MLLREDDSAAKFRKLASLAQAFVFTAEQYARLLIYEIHFPIHKKTIKPGNSLPSLLLSLLQPIVTIYSISYLINIKLIN